MWKIILGIVVFLIIIAAVVVDVVLYIKTKPINPVFPIIPIVSPFFPIINPNGWPEGVVGTLTNATTGDDVLCISGLGSSNLVMIDPADCGTFYVLRQANNIIIKDKGANNLFWYWYRDSNNLISATSNQSNAGNFVYLDGRIVDNLVNPRVMISLKKINNVATLAVVPFNTSDPASQWRFQKL